MMRTEDIEQLLERARFKHLSESTLVSYNDNQLDEVGQALADAHLRLCLICEQRLTFLKEESEALESYQITDEDKASIKKALGQPESRLTDYIAAELKRLNSYVQEVLEAWRLPYRKLAMRGGPEGDEPWEIQSKDKVFTVRTVSNKRGDLTVQFSSIELRWEGFQIHFKLGPFHKDVTLHRKGNKVTAKVVIPKQERSKKMRDVSIDVTSDS
jgi:hypothetical protein